MKSINLIPAARREAKRRRRQRNACIVACCAYGVLLAAAVGVAHFVLAGEDGESLAARLAKTEGQIDHAQQQAAATRAELAAQKATLEADRTVAEQPDWSILLALLARTTGEDVVLRSVVVAPPASAPSAAPTAKGKPTAAAPQVVLELSGVGQSQLAVSQHVLRLEQTGLFSKVTLLDTSREAYVNSNVIAFRLQCQFGEPRQLAITAIETGRINP
jgi:Tfp pilus assembly protein PilN